MDVTLVVDFIEVQEVVVFVCKPNRMRHLFCTHICHLILNLLNGETERGANDNNYDHHISRQLRRLQNNSGIANV